MALTLLRDFLLNDLPLQPSISKYDEEADTASATYQPTICHLLYHFRFMKQDLDLSQFTFWRLGLI